MDKATKSKKRTSHSLKTVSDYLTKDSVTDVIAKVYKERENIRDIIVIYVDKNEQATRLMSDDTDMYRFLGIIEFVKSFCYNNIEGDNNASL